jgi:hypothetical protein
MVQMDVGYFHERVQLFPQCCSQGHGAANAASREDQRFPAAGNGSFVPRCLVETFGGGRQQQTVVPIVETAVPVFRSVAVGSDA